MEINLLDRMLDRYLTEQVPVTVTLQNNVRVSGKIRAFDSYVIIVEGHKKEILYRHAVSCVSAYVQDKHTPRPSAGTFEPAKTARPAAAKSVSNPSRHAQPPQALSPSTNERLTNSMKDGLLKWMQEHKAAK